MKKIALGILAHVDAGKTTLSEGMLYLTGKLKKLGRVDKRDAFLDTHELERERGITIFSKQAIFSSGDTRITLLDTPGHADFAAECERVMPVLDYAVLVISGTDGAQAGTSTFWRLLERYGIPTFIFITKMDLSSLSREELIRGLKNNLDPRCCDYAAAGDEELALGDEEALESYLEAGKLNTQQRARLIRERRLFPCFFGSGLKLDGVEEFLTALDRLTVSPALPGEFGARAYKIARDENNARLTYLKVTGGQLRVRENVTYTNRHGDEVTEKITGIRLYSGAKFDSLDVAEGGVICAVTGLSESFSGLGLGFEKTRSEPMTEPVMTYRVALPSGVDALSALPKLRLLEEEDPLLRIVWNERLSEIRMQLMGNVQIEVLKRLISDRFGYDVGFDGGRIMYRETISARCEGVGHFEPLRHYAEVHLLLEPLPRGAGLVFASACPEDTLARPWQRLILTHLEEKCHLGVLTGSPVTDMRITLVAGRAHVKHTEGGDFREATYRAVRQGLMRAESVLLEPWYAFRMEVPPEQLGRAINDIRAMNGVFETPEAAGEMSLIKGRAPVFALRQYAGELAAYTRGRGKLALRPDGYEPCKNQAAIVDALGYDARADLENTPDSVFCAHGAALTVPWDEAEEYMHLDSGVLRDKTPPATPILRMGNLSIDDKELEAIMTREFGPIRRPMYTKPQTAAETPAPAPAPRAEYLLVDGYNVIFAWEELKSLARENLDLARRQLMNVLANYRGYTKCELVLVFDAYRVPGGEGAREDYHGIRLAYTKQGETADAYIERLAHEIGKNYRVRVISSDSLVQLSAFGSGLLRQTTREFHDEVSLVMERIEGAMASMQADMRPATISERLNEDGAT